MTQSELTAKAPNLDHLRYQLERDYAVVTKLLKASSSDSFMENRMLGVNYQVMRTWYRLSSQFSATAARRAIEEIRVPLIGSTCGMPDVGHFDI